LGVAQVRYVYDEHSRVVGEINASTGAIKSHFVYGTRSHVPDYMIQGGVRYKFVHDHLGSVRMILNTSNGQVVSRMDYDEFGILQSGSLAPDFAPFGFAGGLRDAATGLVRFGARDYDPETGRWTAKDPILFSGGDANLYGYVLADPVNLVDPNGKHPVMIAAGLGALVGATANVLGSYFAGTLNESNFIGTATIGAVTGAAAVLTSGTAALGTATTFAKLFAAELGAGFTGTFVGAIVDLGLSALMSYPEPYPQKLLPKRSCPSGGSDEHIQ